MITGESFFTDKISELKTVSQELAPEQFNNPLDFVFKKAQVEAEMSAIQSSLVEHRKFTKSSSEEEAAILIHSYCKNQSDKLRIELGDIEKLENQEDEKITSDRGRLNGLIDGFNSVRVHFDAQTSEYAAKHERSKK